MPLDEKTFMCLMKKLKNKKFKNLKIHIFQNKFNKLNIVHHKIKILNKMDNEKMYIFLLNIFKKKKIINMQSNVLKCF